MIGIYGGTFDPIHYGHLRTALEVKERLFLDEVRLVPCSLPAHRESPAVSAEMRVDMLSLAAKDVDGFVVDRRELDRDGASYMVDTLKSFRYEYPESSLVLIIGTDAYQGLMSWFKWQQLFDYAHVVVITRPGYKQQITSDFLSSRLTGEKSDLKRTRFGCLFFQTVTQLDISATAIRKALKSGASLQFLLPDDVINYIKLNKLYV